MTLALDHTDPAWYLRDRLEFNQGSDLTNIVKHLFTAMADGRKIDAIKAYRALTGEGLKASKDAVESVMTARPTVNSIYKDDNGEYTYGHFVLTRSADTDVNEWDATKWRCNESDCTLGYARVRATDTVEGIGEGETVFIMKVVARSVTTTSMKDM